MEIKYPNNKQGPRILESPFLFSFGVSERKDIKSEELTGYCLPICFWEKNSNPKPEEYQFYEAIKKVTDICFHHLEVVTNVSWKKWCETGVGGGKLATVSHNEICRPSEN